MARVELANLSKVFRIPKGPDVCAVNTVNLTVAEGEFLVVVGPSGAGKSTLLRLIAGLEQITSGAVSLDGVVINEMAPKDRDVAMVFQNFALYPHLTVRENLAFGLKLRKVPKAELERRVNEAADLLGLLPCLDRFPDTLSGGERQRVALGRALVRQPKVFLLDEPLSNLDAPTRVQMRREIAQLQRALRASMIYVTHDQIEAMTLGHRIAVMHGGVIQQTADPLTLYRHPANLWVAGFIGSPPMNFFRGTVVRNGDRLRFQEHGAESGLRAGGVTLTFDEARSAALRAYVGKPIVLGVRAENLAIKRIPHAGETVAAQDGVTATVEHIEPLGPETFLHLRSDAGAFLARTETDAQFELNRPVFAALDIRGTILFDPATEKAIELPRVSDSCQRRFPT